MHAPPPVVRSIRAPSVAKRAAIAVLLLAGFYGVTTLLVLALLAVPPALVWLAFAHEREVQGVGILWLVAWAGAWKLGKGLVTVRRPRLASPGRTLREHEAPELFRVVRELAGAAETPPPAEVHLAPGMELGVTQQEGHRILTIGGALLARVSVDELRAGLAHELGHFAFGDTRLVGLVSWTHALFASMVESTGAATTHAVGIAAEGARSIGRAVVERYAKLFLHLTRSADQASELAADELAARLVGPAPLRRLLERLAVEAPLYTIYELEDVAAAIDGAGVPSDAYAGFAAALERMKRRGLEGEVRKAASETTTHAWDTHPALPDRLRALEALGPIGVPAADGGAETARSLVALDLEAVYAEMLVARLREVAPNVTPVVAPWSELPRLVLAPALEARARRLGAALAPVYPWARSACALFAAILEDLRRGHLETMARHVEPAIAPLAPDLRVKAVAEVGSAVVATLFSAALLERGASLERPLGAASYRFHWNGQAVEPGVLAAKCIEDAAAAAEVTRWAQQLAAGEVSLAAAG